MYWRVTGMHLEVGRPMRGEALERLRAFLDACGLDYDDNVDFTAMLMEEDEILAAGSLDGNTLKCIAVSPLHQGEGLAAPLMTALREEAFSRGLRHLMLFTKPGNDAMFREFGFYPVIRTRDCLLMENRRRGLDTFLSELQRPADSEGPVGCIVANCNPFTLGHRYLIETAAAQCRWLHVFILSEDRSRFRPEDRIRLVREGCADLKNVLIHPTGPYLISSATFPSYFLRDRVRADSAHSELDVRVFGEKFAPALNITRRFVGTEPNCEVTRAYNEQLKARLPQYGVELIEIERKNEGEAAISASRVRACLDSGDLESIRPLVPPTTFEFLSRL